MTALYIIAGVSAWIAIGVITFRLVDWFFKDDPTWHHPRAHEIGRESHAKMGFWLGPVYTFCVILLFAITYIAEFGKWISGGTFYRKLMGLK